MNSEACNDAIHALKMHTRNLRDHLMIHLLLFLLPKNISMCPNTITGICSVQMMGTPSKQNIIPFLAEL